MSISIDSRMIRVRNRLTIVATTPHAGMVISPKTLITNYVPDVDHSCGRGSDRKNWQAEEAALFNTFRHKKIY